jgi:hypothetical protein
MIARCLKDLGEAGLRDVSLSLLDFVLMLESGKETLRPLENCVAVELVMVFTKLVLI